MLMRYLLLFVAMITMSFEFAHPKHQKESINDQLKGRWVRQDESYDTLAFGYKTDHTFELRRGYSVNHAKNIPMPRFGLYGYQIMKDSLVIHSMTYSNIKDEKYLFRLKDSHLEIGDFIHGTTKVLKFERLKN
jgi:hypothetical protein